MEENFNAFKQETITAAEKLLAAYPNDPLPIGLMGTVHNQFGNTAEAERWWLRVLERFPDNEDAFDVLALAYLRKGQFGEVVALSERALQVNSKSAVVHRRYAEALLELGRLDDALAAIETARAIGPETNEMSLVQGRIHLQRREFADARDAYQQALTLRPGDSRAYFGLSTAFSRLGDADKAGEYRQRFAETRADADAESEERRRATDVIAPAEFILAEALVDIGRLYLAYNDNDNAERSWLRAAEVAPDNVGARVQLVSLYRRESRNAQALSLCDDLTRIQPDNARFHLLSAVVSTEVGQYDRARTAVVRALELAPDDQRARNLYDQLQRNQ